MFYSFRFHFIFSSFVSVHHSSWLLWPLTGLIVRWLCHLNDFDSILENKIYWSRVCLISQICYRKERIMWTSPWSFHHFLCLESILCQCHHYGPTNWDNGSVFGIETVSMAKENFILCCGKYFLWTRIFSFWLGIP